MAEEGGTLGKLAATISHMAGYTPNFAPDEIEPDPTIQRKYKTSYGRVYEFGPNSAYEKPRKVTGCRESHADKIAAKPSNLNRNSQKLPSPLENFWGRRQNFTLNPHLIWIHETWEEESRCSLGSLLSSMFWRSSSSFGSFFWRSSCFSSSSPSLFGVSCSFSYACFFCSSG
jgi:hypothetical protein